MYTCMYECMYTWLTFTISIITPEVLQYSYLVKCLCPLVDSKFHLTELFPFSAFAPQGLTQQLAESDSKYSNRLKNMLWENK